MITRMVPITSPFLHLCSSMRRISDASRIRRPDGTTRHARLSAGFELFRFNAHGVFVGLHFAPRSVGIYLSKLSAEEQDL